MKNTTPNRYSNVNVMVMKTSTYIEDTINFCFSFHRLFYLDFDVV